MSVRRTRLAVFFVLAHCVPSVCTGTLPVIGRIEPVAVADGALVLNAKIDTGADISSLDIDELRIEHRGRREWAVFVTRGKDGRQVRFEQPVVRYAQVKRVTGGAQRRPVVEMALCLGSVRGVAEMNLVDRESMSYPMIIGREFLSGRFVIDPARRATTTPSCPATGR